MPKKQDEARTEQIINVARGYQEGQSLGDRKLDMAALTEITKRVLSYKPKPEAKPESNARK